MEIPSIVLGKNGQGAIHYLHTREAGCFIGIKCDAGLGDCRYVARARAFRVVADFNGTRENRDNRDIGGIVFRIHLFMALRFLRGPFC